MTDRNRWAWFARGALVGTGAAWGVDWALSGEAWNQEPSAVASIGAAILAALTVWQRDRLAVVADRYFAPIIGNGGGE